MEAQALRARGWSISAIATHLDHDRKTIRGYLNGERRPGERRPARPDGLAEFIDYCRQRLADDPHLWLTRLFDEVVELGYAGSYQTFTATMRCSRQMRDSRIQREQRASPQVPGVPPANAPQRAGNAGDPGGANSYWSTHRASAPGQARVLQRPTPVPTRWPSRGAAEALPDGIRSPSTDFY